MYFYFFTTNIQLIMINKIIIPFLLVFTACQNNPAPIAETAEVATNDAPKQAVTADSVKPNTTSTSAHRFAAGGFDDDAAVLAFITLLQKNVAAGNKSAVAEMVNYPLSLNQTKGTGKPQHTEIKNKASFLADYDKIITEGLKNTLKNQDMNDLFVRDQGLMLGNGDIWLSPDAKTNKIGIITINK